MTTQNISDVICCVNCFPRPGKAYSTRYSAVFYIKDADLSTFKPSNVPFERMRKVGIVKDHGMVTWETWDGTYDPPSELPLQIVIFPKDTGERIGGVASVKDDPTKSIPKIFHIYPGKQREDGRQRIPLWQDDNFEYVCVYYGTQVDERITALSIDDWEKKADKKDSQELDKNVEGNKRPDVVPWKFYTSLEAVAAKLEGGNVELGNELQTTKGKLQDTAAELLTTKGKLQDTAAELLTTNGKLQDTAAELLTTKGKLQDTAAELLTTEAKLQDTAAELQTTKEQLETKKEELRKGIDKLKAAAKAVVDAIDDLGNYDNIGTHAGGDDKNKTPNGGDDKNDGGSNKNKPPEGGEDDSNKNKPPEGGEDGSNTNKPPEGGEDGSNKNKPPEGGDDGSNKNKPPDGGDNKETPSTSGET